jgi:hypothetical protein
LREFRAKRQKIEKSEKARLNKGKNRRKCLQEDRSRLRNQSDR